MSSTWKNSLGLKFGVKSFSKKEHFLKRASKLGQNIMISTF